MSRLSKIFDRIEISSLLSQHLTTFYHYEKKTFYNKTEIPASDKFIFLLLPLLLSILLCLCGLKFSKDYVDTILTSLSIFTGLLFTLLTMVLTLVQENAKISITNVQPDEKRKVSARIDLTKHLFINIAFSIVLSIITLVLVLSTQIRPINIIEFLNQFMIYSVLKDVYLYVTNGLSFFFLIEFLLTLLMIVKRFAVLYLHTTE